MRPMASTWVASMQNIPAPDKARLLMWVKCQSFALPPSAEYWHIGATMLRFGSARSRRLIGENRALIQRYPSLEKIVYNQLYFTPMTDVECRMRRTGFRKRNGLRFNPGGLDHLEILRNLTRHERIHLRRRHRERLDAQFRQAFLHHGLGEKPGSHIVKFVDDVTRGLCRHEYAEPEHAFRIFQAVLGGR